MSDLMKIGQLNLYLFMKDSYACIISVLETSTNTDTQDTRDDTIDNKKENVTIKYPVQEDYVGLND